MSTRELEEWEAMLEEEVLAAIEIGQEERTPIETILDFIGDERLFGDLTTEEQEVVLDLFSEYLGFDPEAEPFKIYQTEGPRESLITVSVFRTTEDGVYLRQYTYADKTQSWSIGPERLADEEGEEPVE